MLNNHFFVFISCLGFFLVIAGFLVNLWKRKTVEQHINDSVLIILPFRNEQQHYNDIEARIHLTLLNPEDAWVLVDDGSIGSWTPNLPERAMLLQLENQQKGSKKRALTSGILHGKQELICTTDADSENTKLWIQSMRSGFDSQTDMVIGPVLMKSEHSVVGSFAVIESLCLLTVTMGSAGLKVPLMCSGANLMFRRSTWNSVNGYSQHLEIASGDDVLLMHDFWKRNPHKIGVQLHSDALVLTPAPLKWKDFFVQRKRWASKYSHLTDIRKLGFTALIGLWLISPWLFLYSSIESFALLMFLESSWMIWLAIHFKIRFNLFLWVPFRLMYPLIFIVLPFIPPGKWKPASPTL